MAKKSELTIRLSDSSDAGTRKKIVILSGGHLCTNPRVLKEAEALAKAGYEIAVLGAWLDKSLRERDRALASKSFTFVPVVNFTEGGMLRLAHRAKRKVACLAHRYARVETRGQLGYAGDKQRQKALRQNADLYIAHHEQAMGIAVDLLSAGRRVALDLEDWFSEDLPIEAREQRPVRLLRNLERKLLTGAVHATCPSRAMSNALAREFACVPPAVIYNAFPWSERQSIDGLAKDRRGQCLPSIHWFSQTLGYDRGLEDLVAALPFLKRRAEIHLRGNPVCGFENWLADRIPERWRGRVFMDGLVLNEELLSRIAEHDIGFAGETPAIRSRDLTVTNKILYYLLGGLAVVASDTAGQREVAAQAPGAVLLYSPGDIRGLAAHLNALLTSSDALKAAKDAALKAAERTFCWERQEKVLVDSIERGLQPAGSPAIIRKDTAVSTDTVETEVTATECANYLL